MLVVIGREGSAAAAAGNRQRGGEVPGQKARASGHVREVTRFLTNRSKRSNPPSLSFPASSPSPMGATPPLSASFPSPRRDDRLRVLAERRPVLSREAKVADLDLSPVVVEDVARLDVTV